MIITHYLTRVLKKRRKRQLNSKKRSSTNRSASASTTNTNGKASLDIRDNGGHLEKSGSAEDDEYSQYEGFTQTEEGLANEADDDADDREEDSFGSFNPNLNKRSNMNSINNQEIYEYLNGAVGLNQSKTQTLEISKQGLDGSNFGKGTRETLIQQEESEDEDHDSSTSEYEHDSKHK